MAPIMEVIVAIGLAGQVIKVIGKDCKTEQRRMELSSVLQSLLSKILHPRQVLG